MPKGWVSSTEVVKVGGQVIGNDAEGRSIGVHGLVIVPEYQGKGLGRDLMAYYIEYARTLGQSADGIAIIAHDHLLKFYESFGFKNLGPSSCDFGGGGWYEMVSNLAIKELSTQSTLDLLTSTTDSLLLNKQYCVTDQNCVRAPYRHHSMNFLAAQ